MAAKPNTMDEYLAALSAHKRAALEKLRRVIRSAAPQVDFLPAFAAARVRFHNERTTALHPRDRVGTYGSLHLAEVL